MPIAMRLPWPSIHRGLTVLLLAVGSACDEGEGEAPAVRAMVGQVDEDLFVAVVTDEHELVIYACDGTADAVATAEWFHGPHDGGRFDLAGTNANVRAEGELDATTGEGSLRIDGMTRPFTLAPAEGDAGLYFDKVHDADDTQHWGGWIVNRDGSVRGSVINRNTGGIVAAGEATPSAEVTVGTLVFEVARLEAPVLEAPAY
jgi:hypothetical protein